MLWRCSRGHEWQSSYRTIRVDGCWCPQCFHNERRGKSSLVGIIRADKVALSLGFQILSRTYKNSYEPMEVQHIQCGTKSVTTYHRLTHHYACPVCHLRPPANEADAREWANRLGGGLLGFAERSRLNSTWRCSQGHEWRAAWSFIKKGHWCPYCSGKKSVSLVHKQATAKLYQHKRWDAYKGFQCTLTVEDLVTALKSECIYCGRPATNVDRKDSNVGHTQQNCVPCCGRCNKVKNNILTYDIMIEVGQIFRNRGI